MKKTISLILCLVLTASCVIPAFAAENKPVRASAFGAVANDEKDDSAAIQRAIDHAIKIGASAVVFDKGVYDFCDTPLSSDADGAYIQITKARSLTVSGSVNGDGSPATVFRRYNCGGDNIDLRKLLYAEQCEELTVRDIQFETSPIFYTAGTIESYDKKSVTVKIAEGYPLPEEIGDTKIHLPGLYDTEKDAFYEQRLIWTKEDGSDAPECIIPDASKPDIVRIDNEAIAEKVKSAVRKRGAENLLMFWFQGHFSPNLHMLHFVYCEDLVLDNVYIPSSTGFALTCDMCRNITYKNLRLAPADGKCAVAPRDAMKLYACGGDILMENVVMQGFEDDGQNCHGQFSTVNQVKDEHTLVLNLKDVNPYRPDWLENTHIRFMTADTNEIYAEALILKAKQLSGTTWELTTKEELPSDIICSPENDFLAATVTELEAYTAKSWTVRNCTIRSTYRGLKISAQNVLVENNVFENNVYHIYLGAENDAFWHESKNPMDVTIRNNTFINPLSGTAIDMDFHSYQDSFKEPLRAPVIDGIHIYGNKFIDCKTGVVVKDAKNVFIYDNTFENVRKEVSLNLESIKDIYYVSPEEAENTISADEAARNRHKTRFIAIVTAAITAVTAILIPVLQMLSEMMKAKKG